MNPLPRWRLSLSSAFGRLIALLTPERPPLADYPFTAHDVGLYHRTVSATAAGAVDEQTWQEMLLEPYSARLAPATSIIGQQILHQRLRGAAGAEDGSNEAGGAGGAGAARVRALSLDAPRLARLQQCCEGLRQTDVEISEQLFDAPHRTAPRWSAMLPWLPLGFLLLVAGGLASGWMLLWLGAVLVWLALLGVQMCFSDAVEQWERKLRTMRQLLRSHVLLARLDDPFTAALRGGAARAGKINRAITRSPLDMLPGVREYSDWLLLKNVRHYFASRDTVLLHLDLLRSSFLLVGRLEADLALARHLAATPQHCWVEPESAACAFASPSSSPASSAPASVSDGAPPAVAPAATAAAASPSAAAVPAPPRLRFEQVVHPLLERAAPLDFALDGRGAFISGQNGIGKSTLLRTVGLNLIVARAFGFCYARSASAPALPVYSSMQGEDALSSGESLYIAELRRARELLALAERGPGLFIIDEIFRGTNHIESISAAAAVLHSLAASGLVIVSSHNLVLAPLLADCLTPLCVSAPDGDQSRLRIAPGVLAETNGIALLSARGFGADIDAKARRVFDWLSEYLAEPQDCGQVLRQQAA
ncbi:MutS-related protein [Rugamonas sp. DEMB1]|uniref:MutS-related protein n=1 Tax=Rugamonas sp. DEMB1 TaxID=3039386 RepID=UPI00244C10DE|nr:DNA mismatch repair protein MutS [Rugamonas sp. DEMB1]WGG50128.1 DNA mismatch repair protein MutS [Rugamonas sp. DEMB1]